MEPTCSSQGIQSWLLDYRNRVEFTPRCFNLPREIPSTRSSEIHHFNPNKSSFPFVVRAIKAGETSSFWISLQGFLEVSSWNLRPKMNDSSHESFFLLSTINSREFAWFVSKVNDDCFQSSYSLCNVNKSVGWCLLGLQNLPMSWFLDWSKMFNLLHP